MPSIFRQQYTKPHPTKPGERISYEAEKWYFRYRDADGVLRKVAGDESKEITLQMLAKKLEEAALARQGIVDPFMKHRLRPLSEHLEEFSKAHRAKGTTEEQVSLVKQRCESILTGCEFAFMADFSASRVQTYLADLRKSGRSVQTSNHYVRAIKQFTKWMVLDRRMADNPLAPLETMNTKADRRRIRRALTEGELVKLLEATEPGKTVKGLSGPDRAMLYRVAVYTGYRAGELGSVTPESFDLVGDHPSLSVTAGNSKRRRHDTIPLHPELIAVLTPWLAQKPSGKPVWAGRWAERKDGAKMLRVDLKAAGIAHEDEEGRVVDFHSLRHTFASRLARAGVSVQQAKELMRHSDVNLTMNVYTHLQLHDTSAAISSLPGIGATKDDGRESLKATGTDSRLVLQLGRPDGISSPLVSTSVHFDKPMSSDLGSDDVLTVAGNAGDLIDSQRTGWDLNPRSPYGNSGFQDRCKKMLSANKLGGYRTMRQVVPIQLPIRTVDRWQSPKR